MDLLFILLMQTAAGDPAAAQADQTQATSQAPATEQPQTNDPNRVVVLVPGRAAFDGARCQNTARAGSRVRRVVTCSTDQTRREARETAEWMVNSSGESSRVGGR
jgi:Tfp pilus assembly protein PilV